MKLGFVSAIMADQPFEEVIRFASEINFSCVEVMCWPPGKAERRYAGVTHIDVTDLSDEKIADIQDLLTANGVTISGMSYYANPLEVDNVQSEMSVEHIKKVINAASRLDVGIMNTFIGRDPQKNVEGNMMRFKEVWPPIVKYAEENNVKIGIENCPMFFTTDEWPGGKNLAYCPAIWRRMFEEIPSENFGLNYDPSHLVWLHIDYIKPIYEFRERITHVHLKDAKLHADKLNDVGILATPLEYHTPKLPGLGDVNWGKFFSALSDIGYRGAACIEFEDKAFEDSFQSIKSALIRSREFILNYITL